MWKNLLSMALEGLFKFLSPEAVKDFVDAGLDRLEDKHIEGEVDTFKEKALRQAIDLVRAVMGIDDKKYGTDKE